MEKKLFISHSVEETRRLAQKFARKLKGGDVVGLVGNLGTGKTVFVKGLAQSLGIKENIQSPTFVLMRCYQKIPLKKNLDFCHFDFYRIKSLEDAQSLAIEDYWGKKDVISVIEWADKVKSLLSKRTQFIKFSYLGENERKIEFL